MLALSSSQFEPSATSTPRDANFIVRICHLSHLKLPDELGLMISFGRRDCPLRFKWRNGMNHRPLNCVVAFVVAATLALASPALGRGGGGGGGGHGGGGFGGGGMHGGGGFGGMHGGGWGGGMHAMGAMGGGVRFGGIGGAPRFAGSRFAGMSVAHAGFSPRFSHGAFNHRFFHHRFHRFAFVGVPFAYADYYDDCWRRIWTAYGPQWTNVCGDYGY
jgi:hypothetical protein